jgi:hypothetical protein
MPLVFVHGVNTRKLVDDDGTNPDPKDPYYQAEWARNRYFREIALPSVVANPGTTRILSPYWGHLGASMAWGNACLPLEAGEAFGSDASEVYNRILSEMAPDVLAPPDQLLLTLARKDLGRAVDALWAAAVFAKPGAKPQAEAEAIAALGRKAVGYVQSQPNPAWLQTVKNDDQFVNQLLAMIDAWTPPAGAAPADQPPPPETEAFGIGVGEAWNRLKSGAAGLVGRAKSALSGTTKVVRDATADLGQAAAGAVINPIVGRARPGLQQKASLFLGDVFRYLSQRDLAADGGPIVSKITADLDAAVKAKTADDDKLIVVAHSMGGNIMYDILSHYRSDITCDTFATVGSQVGMFAELGLFPAVAIDHQIADSPARPKAAVASNIRRWINVFDTADVLSYRAAPIFDRAEDYSFSSHVSSLTAHSMYFERPLFYQRLRARLLPAGVPTP